MQKENLVEFEEQDVDTYKIPMKHRKLENLHIIFWLIKDMSWAMLWKPIGLAMIFPTLAVAILIVYNTRKIYSELMHNLAVLFWISANCYWMITEFYFTEALRFYAIYPFAIGVAIILWYYTEKFIFKKNRA